MVKCTKCGIIIKDRSPKFCGECGGMTEEYIEKPVEETIVNEQEKNNREDKIDSSAVNMGQPERIPFVPAGTSGVTHISSDKCLVVDSQALNALKQRGGLPVKNNQIYLIAACVVLILAAVGGFWYWRKNEETKRFNEELAEFKYMFTTQWETILIPDVGTFKSKCDSAFNKNTSQMKNSDKLSVFKTEAQKLQKSLQSFKITMESVKMSDRLYGYKNLGQFRTDLMKALSSNIAYCDNVINLCGEPVNKTKTVRSQGQITMNNYESLYSNQEFLNYFLPNKRVSDLDSIGGMVEDVATNRASELAGMTKKNHNNNIVINIGGSGGGGGGTSGFINDYRQPLRDDAYSSYHNQVKNLLSILAKAREDYGHVPDQYRRRVITRDEFANITIHAFNVRQQVFNDLQDIGNIPLSERDRHQQIINCAAAGAAACKNIAYELQNSANDSRWEFYLKEISDYNNKNLNPILDYYNL
ncbi:MAG TPA: hypothetical protein PLZ62_01095 [bacterium]|nr:hypothetical protein [bacterium]